MEEADVQYHSGSVEYDNVIISPRPRKSNKVQRCYRAARTPLFILVSVVLFGLTIEAYFINRLYRLIPAQTPNTTSGQDGPNLNVSCKPFATLQDVHHGNHTMQWHDYKGCGIDYKDGRLLVQKEGYYYVYSMVSLPNSSVFRHAIKVFNPVYPKEITLMESRKYSQKTHEEDELSNSYLGGVFHLCQGCYIFVKVTNVQNLLKNPDHRFFGAFMI